MNDTPAPRLRPDTKDLWVEFYLFYLSNNSQNYPDYTARQKAVVFADVSVEEYCERYDEHYIPL